jgi:hypothetical protein
VVWHGREEGNDDAFFSEELSRPQLAAHIEAACVDMWQLYELSIEQRGLKMPHGLRQVPHHPSTSQTDEVRRA